MSECEVTQLKAKLDHGDEILLLDVRTAEELEIASIEGSTHIPLYEL